MSSRTCSRSSRTSGVIASTAISESLHVLDPGSKVQNAIYIEGGRAVPVLVRGVGSAAREALEAGAFDYVAGGAGAETTMQANREAFDRRRLRPRMSPARRRDLSVEVLGTRSPAPFLLARSACSRSRIRRPSWRRPGRGGGRRPDDPLERRLHVDRGRRRGAGRRAALVPALLAERPRARRQPRRPRRRAGYGAIVVTLDTLRSAGAPATSGTATSRFSTAGAGAVLQRPALPGPSLRGAPGHLA